MKIGTDNSIKTHTFYNKKKSYSTIPVKQSLFLFDIKGKNELKKNWKKGGINYFFNYKQVKI
jgi:hypothetical protein